jgi:hypothetical protein
MADRNTSRDSEGKNLLSGIGVGSMLGAQAGTSAAGMAAVLPTSLTGDRMTPEEWKLLRRLGQ